jgi:hypothetical protein
MASRLDTKRRDIVGRIVVQRVLTYDGRNPGEARTTYRVLSFSYPNYSPYLRKDSRGRFRRTQRTYKHQYQVVIQLDRLSIDVPFRGRVGAEKKFDFSKKGRPRVVNGRVKEGTNYERGINADFFLRCEWVWKEQEILFGRCYANGPPRVTNPLNIVFAPKHMLNVIEQLMKMGILRQH